MTSPLHPYDPQTVSDGRDGRPSDLHPRHYRAGVVVSYCGPTGKRGALWRGSIKRSATDRAVSASVPSHDGPDAAAVAVLQRAGLPWRLLPAASLDGGNRYVYPAELAPGEGAALAQGEHAVLAMHAARMLAHDTAPYGLALILADLAIGKRRLEPIVAGWRKDHPEDERVTVTDHLGRPLFTLPDTFAPVHAIACARAGGWILSVDALALAQRWTGELQQQPDPAGVAIAREAWEGRS